MKFVSTAVFNLLYFFRYLATSAQCFQDAPDNASNILVSEARVQAFLFNLKRFEDAPDLLKRNFKHWKAHCCPLRSFSKKTLQILLLQMLLV